MARFYQLVRRKSSKKRHLFRERVTAKSYKTVCGQTVNNGVRTSSYVASDIDCEDCLIQGIREGTRQTESDPLRSVTQGGIGNRSGEIGLPKEPTF